MERMGKQIIFMLSEAYATLRLTSSFDMTVSCFHGYRIKSEPDPSCSQHLGGLSYHQAIVPYKSCKADVTKPNKHVLCVRWKAWWYPIFVGAANSWTNFWEGRNENGRHKENVDWRLTSKHSIRYCQGRCPKRSAPKFGGASAFTDRHRRWSARSVNVT